MDINRMMVLLKKRMEDAIDSPSIDKPLYRSEWGTWLSFEYSDSERGRNDSTEMILHPLESLIHQIKLISRQEIISNIVTPIESFQLTTTNTINGWISSINLKEPLKCFNWKSFVSFSCPTRHISCTERSLFNLVTSQVSKLQKLPERGYMFFAEDEYRFKLPISAPDMGLSWFIVPIEQSSQCSTSYKHWDGDSTTYSGKRVLLNMSQRLQFFFHLHKNQDHFPVSDVLSSIGFDCMSSMVQVISNFWGFFCVDWFSISSLDLSAMVASLVLQFFSATYMIHSTHFTITQFSHIIDAIVLSPFFAQSIDSSVLISDESVKRNDVQSQMVLWQSQIKSNLSGDFSANTYRSVEIITKIYSNIINLADKDNMTDNGGSRWLDVYGLLVSIHSFSSPVGLWANGAMCERLKIPSAAKSELGKVRKSLLNELSNSRILP
jgi:hypothetical protein